MKKLLVAFAAIVAVSFASCGGNTEATVEDTLCCDSCCEDTCCVVEEVVDTLDSLAEEVVEEVAE